MTTNFGKVKVIGLGGAGSNFIKYLMSKSIKDIEVIAANTDKDSLKKLEERFKVPVIRFGHNLDLNDGAKGDPEIGLMAARDSYDELKKSLKGSDIIFIRAGMGSGTGSGASIVVAEIARKIGAITIALVSMPFYFEGPKRKKVAEDWFEKLRQKVDGVAILPNDILLKNQSKNKGFQSVLQEGECYFEDIIKVLTYSLKQNRKFLLNFFKTENSCFIGAGHDWGIDGLKNGVINAIESLSNFNNIEIKDLNHAIILIYGKKIENKKGIEVINDLLNSINKELICNEDNEFDDDEIRCVIITK